MADLWRFITFYVVNFNLPCELVNFKVFHVSCLNLLCVLLIINSRRSSIKAVGYCRVCSSCYYIAFYPSRVLCVFLGAMGPAPGDISMTFADDTDEPPSEAGSTVSDLVTGTESLSDSHSDIAKPCVADFLQPLNEKESSDSSVKLTTEAVAQLYTGIERSPDKISQQHMGQNNNLPRSPGTGFVRRNMPLSSALKYRLRCQCGAKNCRQYLF